MSYEKMRRCVKCGVSGYFGQRRDCPFGSCDGKLVQVDEVPSVADLAILDNLRLAQRIADLEAELARLRAAPEVTVDPLKLARWILNRGNNWPDHACRQCFPDYPVEAGSCLERGIAEKFVCAFHLSEALVAGLRHAEKP